MLTPFLKSHQVRVFILIYSKSGAYKELEETLSSLRKMLAKEELVSLHHSSGDEESASAMLFQALEIEEAQ